jgi:hypothetical protein
MRHQTWTRPSTVQLSAPGEGTGNVLADDDTSTATLSAVPSLDLAGLIAVMLLLAVAALERL